MGKRKKIAIGVMAVIGGFLVLLFILMLFLPSIIKLEPIKQKIIARISQDVGGELEFQGIDLSFLPRPRVIIHQGSLSIPGKVAGTLEALKVYPKILPLLMGRIRIAMLRVEAPQFKMELTRTPREKGREPKTFALATIKEEGAVVLALVASKAPGLVIVVERGRLNLSEDNKPVVWFQDIEARISLPPDKFKIDLTCASNLWESMSMGGWLTTEGLKGGGRIQVRDLKPQVLTDNLLPLAPRRVGESRVNLDVSFTIDGLKVLEGEIEGSFPLLTLRQANENLVIKGKSLRGAFHADEERITVSLTELDLDHPQLKMSGKLFMDRTIPLVSVEMEGREIDLNSIREVALVLAGEIPDVQGIFEIVKGGKVPLVTMSTQGSSPSDLGKLENILIKGHIREGNIYVPGAGLDLKDVKGEVVISKGVLEGTNLEAKFGNTWGREGIVKLGLEGEDAPFHLETVIEVDLAELPFLVKGLITDEEFRRELVLIDDIRGNALGRLVLGESTGSINVKVDVSKCNLYARYGRIPYPVEIKNGGLFYDGNTFGVRDLSGKVGKSSFSELNARLRLEKAPFLEILSGKSSLSVREIYSWLSSLEGLDGELKKLRSVQGNIGLSELGMKGPLLKPEKWRFQVKGQVADLVMESSLFPGTVTVTRAGFMATREEISLEDCETGILDASVRGSGILHGYLENLQKADFTLQGNLGPKAIQWIGRLVDVPPELRIRAPLGISRAHAGWDKGGKTSFSADLAVKDGPELSIDMRLNPEELVIDNVLIRDRASHASFALRLKKRELHLGFKGHLDKATLDKVFMKNEILKGRIDGDFEAHILMDRPMRTTAKGILQGVGLGYPLGLKVPVTIENVSLKARENRLNMESALLTWGDSHLKLKGTVDFSEDEFHFAMDLSADGIEWEKIQEILQEGDKETGNERHRDFWAMPLEGTLRVSLGYLRYGKLTWKPVHAVISFMAGGIKVAVTEATVCDISTPGVVHVTPPDVSLDFKPIYRGRNPGHVLACLFGIDLDATGDADFKGEITSRAKPEELVQYLRGDFEFTARDGRIYRSVPLSRILGLLNTTEIIRGKLPDLGKEGLAYEFIQVKGNLQGGKLKIREGIMNGRSMEIAAQGEIDLIHQQMDLTLLVAPFKTVDFAVKKIPLVRDILQGTLVSIPVRVQGDLGNPTVRPLSPSAVGSELAEIMKRAFRLPIKMIQPLRRGKGEE